MALYPVGSSPRKGAPVPIRKEQVGWREDALCGRGKYSPELWFTTTTEARRLAKSVCRRCPVLDECTEYTLTTPPRQGIHAGMTLTEVVKRQRLRRAS